MASYPPSISTNEISFIILTSFKKLFSRAFLKRGSDIDVDDDDDDDDEDDDDDDDGDDDDRGGRFDDVVDTCVNKLTSRCQFMKLLRLQINKQHFWIKFVHFDFKIVEKEINFV